MRYNQTGAKNIAVGYNSLSGNISGGNNIAMGESSLAANNLSGSNIAIGNFSLQKLKNTVTGIDNNTALGLSSGRGLITGKIIPLLIVNLML